MYRQFQRVIIGIGPRADSGRHLEQVLFNLPWRAPRIPAPINGGKLTQWLKDSMQPGTDQSTNPIAGRVGANLIAALLLIPKKTATRKFQCWCPPSQGAITLMSYV